MEALAIIGLIENVIQFVDFGGELIAKSTELYQSSEGALVENIDVETATNHPLLLWLRPGSRNRPAVHWDYGREHAIEAIAWIQVRGADRAW